MPILDLLPTLVKLAGGTVPSDRVIDGKNIWPLLSGGDGASSPHEAIYYWRGRSLQAIRVGDWKYRHTEDKVSKDGSKKKELKTQLFNLRKDIGEQKNVIDEYPAIAARLKKQMEMFNAEFRKNLRSPGVAEEATPASDSRGKSAKDKKSNKTKSKR